LLKRSSVRSARTLFTTPKAQCWWFADVRRVGHPGEASVT
jgi:hypothetical protein